ncbi:MAG: HEAT repeat domain-containing protein [Candidatus Riflebacteria bacterium]|nr:HEAT repeat domain-containing protein [Candidatus Riflebacteria bacterium]
MIDSVGARPRRYGLLLICFFHFGIRFSTNIFFVIAQTLFFSRAGVTSLPWVYTVMNVCYIAIQGLSMQKLKARSAVYLPRLCFAFTLVTGLVALNGLTTEGLSGAGVPGVAGNAASPATIGKTFAAPGTVSWVPVTVFLLIVMIYELFFNQFFTHYLNDLFPLQEGKASLPIITAAGSLSFIASGLFLKIALSALSINIVLITALALYTLFQLLLPAIATGYAGIARTQATTSTAPPSSYSAPEYAENPAKQLSTTKQKTICDTIQKTTDESDATGKYAENSGVSSVFSTFGRAFCLLAFFGVLAKYWLDYQYSRAITDLFRGENELAGFIGLFSASTDALVLIAQLTIVGRVLKKVPLPAVAGFLPGVVMMAGIVPLITGSAIGVLVTQFLFTFVAKTFFNPALGLLPAVLPPIPRLRLMGAMGISASVGAMIAGISLLLLQKKLSVQAAFILLTIVFAVMLLLIKPIREGYRHELLAALDGIDIDARIEALSPLIYVDERDRTAGIASLLKADDETARLTAIAAATALQPHTAVELLSPLLTDTETSKIRTATVHALATLGGGAASPTLVNMLSEPGTPSRIKATLIEGFGEFPGGREFLKEIMTFLAASDHRLRAAAAASVIRLGSRREELETALRILWKMLNDKNSPSSRAAAVSALGRLQHETFLPELEAALNNDPDPRVATLAVQALAHLPIQRSADVLSKVCPSERFTEAVVMEAHRAREAIERVALGSIVSLFESLTSEERAALSEPLSHIGDATRHTAVAAALTLPDPAARGAFSRFLLDLENRDLLEFFSKLSNNINLTICVPTSGRSSGSPGSQTYERTLYEWNTILEKYPADRPLNIRQLSPLFQGLLERDACSMYDFLLTSLWKRLLFVEACRERLSRALPGTPLLNIAPALEEEFRLLASLTARRCSSPADTFEAMKKGLSDDRFALSLVAEVLRPQLGTGPANLAGIVTSFLTCHAGHEAFASAARALCGCDADSLSIEALTRTIDAHTLSEVSL